MTRRATWGVAAAVLALSALAYEPTLGFKFVQDSFHAVKANSVVSRGNLYEIVTSDYWKGTVSPARTLYRPVTVASYVLDRKLGGGADPAVSHLTNILLHDLVALLLFLYARRLGAGVAAAAFAALLFTVHPLLMQGVANIVGRADLLALLFTLGALLAMSHAGAWRGEAPPSTGRVRAAIWGGSACLLLALGSKEVALATPLLLVGQEWLFRDRPGGTRIQRLALIALPTLAILIYLQLRTLAIGDFPGMQRVPLEDNVLVSLHGWPRWITTLAIAGRYLALLLAPLHLSPDYSGQAIGTEESLFAFYPLLGLLLLAACIAAFALWPNGKLGAESLNRARMGVLLFALPYLVVGNVIVLNAAGFAERLIYLSASGFCLVLSVPAGALLQRFPAALGRYRWQLAILTGAALVSVALYTRMQSRMWENNRTMFGRALKVAPKSLRAYKALAEREHAAGKIDAALALYEQALTEVPGHDAFRLEQGILLLEQGRWIEARAPIEAAVASRPESGEAQLYLGRVLHRLGSEIEAERALRKALLWQPALLDAAAELGDLLYEQRRFAEAAHFYRGCVRLGRGELRRRLAAAEAAARAERR